MRPAKTVSKNPLNRLFWTPANLTSKKQRIGEVIDRFSWEREVQQISLDQQVDGENDWVHPSVLYMKDGWNGHSYWMGINAYPNTQGKGENPYFFFSDDGEHWHTPEQMKQPLYRISEGMLHNSDAEIFMDHDGLTMHYLNRAVYDTKEAGSSLEMVSSVNGVDWMNRKTVLSGPYPDYLSPSVCKVNGTYYMFLFAAKYSLHEERDYTNIVVLEAEEAYGEWREINRISTGKLGGLWHGEVRYINETFVVLGVTGDAEGGALVLGGFSSVMDQTFADKKIIVRKNKSNYKSSLVIKDKKLEIYMGYKTPGLGTSTKWRVGKLKNSDRITSRRL